MIKQAVITSFAAAVLLLSVQASADQNSQRSNAWKNKTPVTKHVKFRQPAFNVNREQREQAAMIQQGIKKCQITPKEARVLNKQQARINKTERQLKKNGLNRREANQLKSALKSARIQINRLTKNRKTCGGNQRRTKRNNRH